MTEQEPAAAAPRRVVVAEDESLIRLDIVETLRDNGFEVVGEAGDGEAAVALATELRPDLVIMDVKMPLLDGISAAEKLSKPIWLAILGGTALVGLFLPPPVGSAIAACAVGVYLVDVRPKVLEVQGKSR